MSRHTRRQFLKHAAATAGVCTTCTIAGTKSSGQVLGANEVVRVGVAGIRGRGGSHIDGFASMKGAQVTYLIDPDSSLFKSRTDAVKKRGGNEPKCVQDVRKALEDKNLDAVSIATCNHWHSLITIWACQAGKDVYVEKPCSHNVFEGRKCVEAARKYNRIVQHGTQQRSDGKRAAEIADVWAGKYGKLLVSKGYASKPRGTIGVKEPTEPPKTLDYDLWVGPAPMQPFRTNVVPYNWHWHWDFGNGEIGNQGVHQMDVARWGIPGDTLPKSVFSFGGRYGYKDQGQTPNMQVAVFDYGDSLLVFETFGLVGKNDVPIKVQNEFHTTEGVVREGKFYPKEGGKTHDVKVKPIHVTPGGCFGSFIACVRSRKVEEVNGEIFEAHLSAALCHLANASYRLGKPTSFSEKPAVLGDNPQVNQSWADMVDILKKYNVPLEGNTYQLGPVLKFDTQTEKFVDNDEANKLITRKYRAPYVVPESV